MNKLLLMVAANYRNFTIVTASSIEEAQQVLTEMPEQIIVSESNGFYTDDYYVAKNNVVIVENKEVYVPIEERNHLLIINKVVRENGKIVGLYGLPLVE